MLEDVEGVTVVGLCFNAKFFLGVGVNGFRFACRSAGGCRTGIVAGIIGGVGTSGKLRN